MEEQKLKLEILKEIRQIELNWANRQYPFEVADFLLKKNKQLLRDLSGSQSNENVILLRRSKDEKPTRDGWYFNRRYGPAVLVEFKDGDWNEPKGYKDWEGNWNDHPKCEWWEWVLIKE